VWKAAAVVGSQAIVVSIDVKGGSIWKRNGTVKLWDNPDFMLHPCSGARDAGSRRRRDPSPVKSTEME